MTTHELINKQIEDNQDTSHRRHLGGSEIGQSCERKLWYKFRHTKSQVHSGRILRLFNRGHEEEDRFCRWLRGAGITIYDRDPETGKQYMIEDCHGHFGGSLDGIATGFPEHPGEWLLVEMKTHGESSFKKLEKEGVLASKPIHFDQMQVYMRKWGLARACYIAVNKNNDELYIEFIDANAYLADQTLAKAWRIVGAQSPPERAFSSPNAMGSDFDGCKFCPFVGQCWSQEPYEPSCRNCVHGYPAADKAWGCSKGYEFGKVCQDYQENV